MTLSVLSLLFFAGLAGGIINALAGGATLITFPAMLASGLPPVTANTSNALAIAQGHLLAAIADRQKLPRFDAPLIIELGCCAVGAGIGAVLLLSLPEGAFLLPVPALILFGTLLFLFSPQIATWCERRRAGGAPKQGLGALLLLGSSLYGGFFGAGLGVILSAVLAVADPHDIRRVKVLKNLLATSVSLVAATIFVLHGAIAWMQTIVMLSGALIGGYLGGTLIRILPSDVVRWFVIVAGLAMSLIYAARYWF